MTENGDDSPFPGSQAVAMVDDHGNPLPGAPALVPYLNMGTANFNGYITTGTQSVGHPALTVTSMAPYTITAATFSAATGLATFTTSTSPTFEPGSEFTVTGITNSGPGSFNLTYVAVAGTTLTGTTIVGNPLSGPLGTPQVSALTNSSVMTGGSSPQMVSVIMPGMRIFGATPTNNFGVISPFGTYNSSGTGGFGTYGMTTNPASFPFGVTVPSNGVYTATGLTTQQLTIGTNLIGTDSSGNCGCTSIQITGFGTGLGTAPTLNGTYQTNYNTLGGTGTFSTSTANGVGSSGSPAPLFASPPFYQSIIGTPGSGSLSLSPPSTTFTVTPVPQTTIGDFVTSIGTELTTSVPGVTGTGWSGTLANVADLWMPGATSTSGGFPTQAGGAPSTSALAGLCKKNPNNDIQQFAAANGFTVHSLYRLNDPGIFADSSVAGFTGSISGASGSTATLNVTSTQTGSTTAMPNRTVIGGVGFCANTVCPTTTGGSGSTYALSFGAGTAMNASSEAMTAGAYVPAVPTPTSAVNGWIDQPGGVPTLHVS